MQRASFWKRHRYPLYDVFSKALLPTLAAAVAASGGIVSAGVKQVATAFFAELLITLIRNVFMPLVYVCAAAAAAEAMLPGHGLGRIGKGVSKAVTWVLTGALILFTGYLAVSGALSGSSDALTAQLTKNAISTAVPVVGGIISDAAGSVLAGALVLKNAVGAFGMLAVIAICLLPFLRLAVQYLLYKLTAFLAATVGSAPLVGLIDALGSAFGLVLGQTVRQLSHMPPFHYLIYFHSFQKSIYRFLFHFPSVAVRFPQEGSITDGPSVPLSGNSSAVRTAAGICLPHMRRLTEKHCSKVAS